MKKYLFDIRALVAATFCFAAASLFIGCENESAASASLSVSPPSATLTAANASVALRASGGWNYSWSLSDSSIGQLNKASGKEVLYTASVFGSNTTQVITVSATSHTNSVNGSTQVTILQK